MSFYIPDAMLIQRAADDVAVFGWELQVNLGGGDQAILTDGAQIRRYLTELCALIGMEAYREPVVVSFGKDPRVAGFTAVQLITTSNITLHAVDANGALFLNVFSCKVFDPAAVTEFTAGFFRAAAWTEQFTTRRAPNPEEHQ